MASWKHPIQVPKVSQCDDHVDFVRLRPLDSLSTQQVLPRNTQTIHLQDPDSLLLSVSLRSPIERQKHRKLRVAADTAAPASRQAARHACPPEHAQQSGVCAVKRGSFAATHALRSRQFSAGRWCTPQMNSGCCNSAAIPVQGQPLGNNEFHPCQLAEPAGPPLTTAGWSRNPS